MPPNLKGVVVRAAKRALKVSRKTQGVHLSLVSATEMKRLNQIYRKKNKVTDVLSFGRGNSPAPELGDVVICVSQARKQAPLWNNNLERELERLAVHGVLHLLGYDHEKSKKDAEKMQKLEETILFPNGLNRVNSGSPRRRVKRS